MLNAIACQLQEARRILAHHILAEDLAKASFGVGFAVFIAPLAFACGRIAEWF